MHEPGCWCNAGVCIGHMATAAPFPEAGERAQNKHVQMRVSMFVCLARVGGEGRGGVGLDKKKQLHTHTHIIYVYIYIKEKEKLSIKIFSL